MPPTISILDAQAIKAPAEQALAAIADLLTDASYDLTIPSGDGDAYFRISNALGALTGLTISSQGNAVWEYRSIHGIHVDPARLVAITLDVLDPEDVQPRPEPSPHRPSMAIHAAARHALASLGMTTVVELACEAPGGLGTFAQTAAANPRCPGRGIVHVCDDGELRWHIRAPHHRDGGLPLTDITATITRALTRAGHLPSNA